ncbi:MAG: FecR domain-containing protein [Opitutales bacterium]
MKTSTSTLISGYFDDALSASELRELEVALKNDPAALREFLEVNEQDALLKTLGDRKHMASNVREILMELKSRTNSPVFARGVRRTLVQRKPKRQRESHFWAVAAMITLLLGGWFLWGISRETAQPIPVLAGAEGEVEFQRNGNALILRNGESFATLDRIQTGADGSVTLRYPGEDTEVVVGSSSVVSLPAGEKGQRLIGLYQGKVTCHVAPQSPGTSFEVLTPYHRARVIGTRFSFEISKAAGISTLDVEEGVVELTGNEDAATDSVNVSAGNRVTLREGAPAQAVPRGNRRAVLLRTTTEETPAESLIRQRLAGLAFEVLTFDPARAPEFEQWDLVDLVFLSPSVSAGQLHAGWRDAPVPLVTGDPEFLHALGISLGHRIRGDVSGDGQLRDLNLAPHLRNREDLITVTRPETVIHAFTLPDGARPMLVHGFSPPPNVAMCGLEHGMETPVGTLPAQRVILFFQGEATNRVTADGWACFYAGIQWALESSGDR